MGREREEKKRIKEMEKKKIRMQTCDISEDIFLLS